MAGQILADSARRIILELETMGARLQAEKQNSAACSTVAACPVRPGASCRRAMNRPAPAHPRAAGAVPEVASHHAVDLVAGGSADLAVAHDWVGVPMGLAEGMEARHLGDDISDVLVGADHPAAAGGVVELQEFINDWWLYEPGSVAHDFLLHEFSRFDGVVLGHMIVEYATQIEMVGAGLGVALVPRMGRGPLPPSVRTLAVRSPPLRRVHGVWRRSSAGRPAIRAALDALASACGTPTPRSTGRKMDDRVELDLDLP